MFTIDDERYMIRALALARRGWGFVSPNPMVGAVIVKNGRMVGKGWHKKFGGPHAEIEALEDASGEAKGATMYVTLEPCNHYGKTPPCTEAIIKAGISRVVVAMRDPNFNVEGGGCECLRNAGIAVDEGLCEEEARVVNIKWIHWLDTGRPFVLLKLACSLDGKLAFGDDSRRWISCGVSQGQVHRLRRGIDAIMVGAGTVRKDNPSLTNRSGKGGQPLRVIVDPLLTTDIESHVYEEIEDKETSPNTIVVCRAHASADRRTRLEEKGVGVMIMEDSQGRIDLGGLLDLLGEQGVQSVLCEGGARLASSLLGQSLCDMLLLYHAPLLIGDKGKSFVDDSMCELPFEMLSLIGYRKSGSDLCSLWHIEKEINEE